MCFLWSAVPCLLIWGSFEATAIVFWAHMVEITQDIVTESVCPHSPEVRQELLSRGTTFLLKCQTVMSAG